MKIVQYSLTLFLIWFINLAVWGQSNSSVGPLIQNDWTTFTWPYNAYLPEVENGGVNGHVGNACGHTVIARLLHYYGFPVNGNSVLDFTDYFGNKWYCDLTEMNLNYTAMPASLDWDSSQEEFHQVANLFLASSAAGEKIQIGFRDAHLKIPEMMAEYFNFVPGAYILNRWDYSKEEWIEIFKYELDRGRPILVVGRTEDSPPPWDPGGWQGHWWICDGYNENDEFYINYSYGGIKGYYDIDNLGGVYTAFNTIIAGLEPDLGGRSIAITSPLTGDVFELNEEITIEWQSSNVNELNISLSLNDGWTWENIASNVSANLKSFTWNTGETSSDECLIKITDADDVNIYENSEVFTIDDNTTSVDIEDSVIPSDFVLHQNFPNPFNPTTTIYYSVSNESYVEIVVYDMLGKEIVSLVSETKSAGYHNIEFNGGELNSGVYFAVMKSGFFISTKKLLLMK